MHLVTNAVRIAGPTNTADRMRAKGRAKRAAKGTLPGPRGVGNKITAGRHMTDKNADGSPTVDALKIMKMHAARTAAGNKTYNMTPRRLAASYLQSQKQACWAKGKGWNAKVKRLLITRQERNRSMHREL